MDTAWVQAELRTVQALQRGGFAGSTGGRRDRRRLAVQRVKKERNAMTTDFQPIRDDIGCYPGPMDGCFADGERVLWLRPPSST